MGDRNKPPGASNVSTLVPQPNNIDLYSDLPSDRFCESSNDLPPPPSPLFIARQPINLNPSKILVVDSTIHPGDSPITLLNTPPSLAGWVWVVDNSHSE